MCVGYMQILCHFYMRNLSLQDFSICEGPGTDPGGYQGTTVLTKDIFRCKYMWTLEITFQGELEAAAWPRLDETLIKRKAGASLVAQWLRICLPMQGTRVRALVCEDPTCRGATRPVSHNY